MTITDEHILEKMITGTDTELASSADVPTNGTTLKIEVDGRSIKGFIDGVEKISVTDTVITTNFQCGLDYSLRCW